MKRERQNFLKEDTKKEGEAESVCKTGLEKYETERDTEVNRKKERKKGNQNRERSAVIIDFMFKNCSIFSSFLSFTRSF